MTHPQILPASHFATRSRKVSLLSAVEEVRSICERFCKSTPYAALFQTPCLHSVCFTLA